MRRIAWWVVGIAAAAGLAAGAWLTRPALPSMTEPSTARPATPAAAPAALAPGDRVPAFTLPDLDGMPVRFPDRFLGRPLLINVWASWCAPCIEEMPELQRFANSQGATGTQVIGLALDTPEAIKDFLTRVPVDYPILVDTPGPADASVWLGNRKGVLPYSVLVGADGKIVKQKIGPFAHGEIEGWAKLP